ncbi:MAG: phosphatase PAP2 family protein [Fimbriimonas sp.]
MGALNESVFRAVNGWPTGLTPLMRFFSEGSNWTWVRIALGTLVLALIFARGRGRAAAIQALLAFPLANGITDLFKKGLPMPRPCNDLSNVLGHGIGCSESMGTASAHSANMAAVAFVFVYHLGWWGSPWVLVALLTGISRMYHGAHYPYQVLLGWTCGVVAAFVITKAAELIRKKRADVSTEESAHEVPIA